MLLDLFTPYSFQYFDTPMESNIVELPMQMVVEPNLLSKDDLSSILILQNNCSAMEYIEPRSKRVLKKFLNHLNQAKFH